MKIVLASQSDTLGGAAVVTRRLMDALCAAGEDARMVVSHRQSADTRVAAMGGSLRQRAAFLGERLEIAAANGWRRDDLFKVSTGHFATGIASHPWVKEADTVLLNWVNQGLSGLHDIERLHAMGKRLVWTMHDMWCMTGICHHAFECQGYTAECGDCPFLRGEGHPRDLSHRVWQEKERVFSRVPITFVAISSWQAQKARESSLLRNQEIVTIPNAFPVEEYSTHCEAYVPGLDPVATPNVLLMGAARLDDPIKGLDYAIDALNILADTRPELAPKSRMVFFGDLRDPKRLDRLRFPHRWLGMVHDNEMLHRLYASARVVLSTSLYETLPTTLIEGQAAGCLPVTFGKGGQPDIVTHLCDGYIARYQDAADIATGIRWALAQPDTPSLRQQLHASVATRFAAPVIARRYLRLLGEP